MSHIASPAAPPPIECLRNDATIREDMCKGKVSETNLDLEGVTGERVVLVEEVGGRFAAINILAKSA